MDEIMKTVVSSLYVLLLLVISCAWQPAYAASPDGLPAMAVFLKTVDDYNSDKSLFTSAKDLTVHGRFGRYPIAMYRLSKCNPTTLSTVVAILTKHDADVEIPRISTIYYDSCVETVAAGDKGDIYIPNSAAPVWITFRLQGHKRTKWKKAGADSVFVGKPSTSAIVPPVAPGPLPCGGAVIRNDDTSISFPMCSMNPQTTFYAYALHMDQIGSDGIGVDIGIDPQIINHPPGRNPTP
jgi:hypothetical protein